MAPLITERERRQARAREQRRKARARNDLARKNAKKRAILANVMEWALMCPTSNRHIARKLLSDALNNPEDRKMFGLD